MKLTIKSIILLAAVSLFSVSEAGGGAAPVAAAAPTITDGLVQVTSAAGRSAGATFKYAKNGAVAGGRAAWNTAGNLGTKAAAGYDNFLTSSAKVLHISKSNAKILGAIGLLTAGLYGVKRLGQYNYNKGTQEDGMSYYERMRDDGFGMEDQHYEHHHQARKLLRGSSIQ